jgi:hypothetical protein
MSNSASTSDGPEPFEFVLMTISSHSPRVACVSRIRVAEWQANQMSSMCFLAVRSSSLSITLFPSPYGYL